MIYSYMFIGDHTKVMIRTSAVKHIESPLVVNQLYGSDNQIKSNHFFFNGKSINKTYEVTFQFEEADNDTWKYLEKLAVRGERFMFTTTEAGFDLGYYYFTDFSLNLDQPAFYSATATMQEDLTWANDALFPTMNTDGDSTAVADPGQINTYISQLKSLIPDLPLQENREYDQLIYLGKILRYIGFDNYVGKKYYVTLGYYISIILLLFNIDFMYDMHINTEMMNQLIAVLSSHTLDEIKLNYTQVKSEGRLK